MKNEWNVKIEEEMFHVKLVNKKKVLINGEKVKPQRKTFKFSYEEYEFPLGSKTAMVVLRNLSKPLLVIDNKDCATGEEYVPQKLPIWAYVFMALYLPNIFNGAVGWCIGLWGIMITMLIAGNEKLSLPLKILFNVVILIALYTFIFGFGLLVASVTY